jgi:hypothetical protein
MPVYVGVSMWELGRMIMCHMVADTEAELDAMADKIGVARKWKQERPDRRGIGGLTHYDIAKSKRALAVKHGAIPLDTLHEEAEVLERLADLQDKGGSVRDIRTGAEIDKTSDLTGTFLAYCARLQKHEKSVYVVRGRAQHDEVRQMLDRIKELGIPLVYDTGCPPDRVFILAGTPDEWDAMHSDHDLEHRHGYWEVGDY